MSDSEYQPLKGDPSVLAAKAKHYLDIADAIARSVVTLKKIHDVDDMKSKATEALKDSADDVADDINKAHDRYKKTADALLTYSYSLEHAQHLATQAISRINDKQSAADTANAEATRTKQEADDAKGPDADDATTKATTAKTAAHDANAELAKAQDDWRDALKIKNDAAHTASQAIIEVVDKHNNGLKNPGFWEKLGKAVLNVVKKICEIASILSIFLSWVPILGEVLLALALIGAIITLVESIVAFANGGSFTDVLFAAAGLVLTAFGGKIFAYLGKLSKFKAAQTAMTHGNDFLNKKAFKAAFGVSKSKLVNGELKNFFHDGPGFKTMMKEIRNPFDSGLGKGNTFAKQFENGLKDPFKKGFTNFLKNNGGIGSLGEDAKYVFKGTELAPKIAFIANDVRGVTGTVDTLYNEGDKVFGGGNHQVHISTDSLVQAGAGKVEHAIRN